MLRKTLFVTTALVVASSMAFAKGNVAPALQNHLGTKADPVRVHDGWKASAVAVRPAGFKPLHKSTAGRPAMLPAAGLASNLNKDANAAYLGSFGWNGVENGASSSGTNSYSFYICLSNSCAHLGHVTIGNEKFKNSGVKAQAAVAFKAKKGTATSVTLAIGSLFGAPASGTISIYNDHTATSHAPCGTGNGFSTISPSHCPGTPVAGATGTFTASHAWSFSTTPCCGNLQTVTIGSTNLSKKKAYWLVMGSGGAAGNTVIWMGSDSNFTATMNGYQQDFNVQYSGYTKYHYTATSNGHTGNLTFSFNDGSKGWVGDLESFDYYAQPGAYSIN